MTTRERVAYRGGPLHGAVLAGPASLAEIHPTELSIRNGQVWRRNSYSVPYPLTSVQIIEPPTPRLTEEPPPRKATRRRKKSDA